LGYFNETKKKAINIDEKPEKNLVNKKIKPNDNKRK